MGTGKDKGILSPLSFFSSFPKEPILVFTYLLLFDISAPLNLLDIWQTLVLVNLWSRHWKQIQIAKSFTWEKLRRRLRGTKTASRLPEPQGGTFVNELQLALTGKIMPQPSRPVFGDGSAYQVWICSLKTDTCFTHISLGTQGFKGWRKDFHGFPTQTWEDN